NVFVAAVAAFLLGGMMAVIDNVFVFEPLRRRGANVVILMIASLGLWIFYKYFLYSVVDAASRVIKVNLVSQLIRFENFPSLYVGGYVVKGSLLMTILFSFLLMGLLYIILQKTAIGKAIRAISDNPGLAEISGIPRSKVLNFMWFLAGGIASIGGMLWITYAIATPEVGDTLILQIFAIAVIGGLNSLLWTSVGAFIIAAAETIGMALLNQYFGVPTSFKPFITFSTLLTVIIAFPPLGAGGGLPYRFIKKRRGEK
ncbi:MAG: hypothetical protein DRO10_00655, partial [Thermoprotei archaeon]